MLSIIIITKNEELYLPKLLESIKKQNFSDYELIVSDAESKDKSLQIAKKYKCKIVKGGLPAIGRNNGAKKAKGDLLLFLDSDIILPKDFLRKNISEFKKRKLDAAGCYVKSMSKKTIMKFYDWLLNIIINICQYTYPQMPGYCIFSKKELHNKIKGFDSTIVFGEDEEYTRRAGKAGKFRMLKSKKILSSVRRYEKEGYLKLGLKYVFYFIYRLLFGSPRKEILEYKFDHYKKD